jgi:prolipoprotein diacylglyceryl transferase
MNDMLATLASPTRNVIEIGPLTIHFYGILIAIGVIVAVLVTKKRYEGFGGDGTMVERVAIWAVIVGFLGARLGYVTTHTHTFEGRPWAALYIWEGGLALYGGLLAGALTAIYLLHRWRGDLFSFADAAAVGIPLAQAIGRWGNYFNQELFGTPTDLPWGLAIAPGNRPDEYLQYDTFHPTFLYESLWNLVIVVPAILILERMGKLYKGASFALYVVLYGIGRFIMELLRTDTTFRFLGLSRNGWVSLLAVAGGLVALVWLQRRREPQEVDPEARPHGPEESVAAATDSNASEPVPDDTGS